MSYWDFMSDIRPADRKVCLNAEYPPEGSGPITLIQSSLLQTVTGYTFVFPRFEWDFIVRFFRSYVKSPNKPWTKRRIMLRFFPGDLDEDYYKKQGEIEGVEIWKEKLFKDI